VHLFQ